MKRVLCNGGALLLIMLGIGAPVAEATSLVHFNQPGPTAVGAGEAGAPFMKNLYVDIIFWGWGDGLFDPVSGSMEPDAQQVLNNVQYIADWLNTGWLMDHTGSGKAPVYLPGNSGAGWEPAVHLYGVSGIWPGLWVNDNSAIPWWYQTFPTGNGSPDEPLFGPIVDQAQSGAFGSPRDFQNTFTTLNGLPRGSNRLALVVTKGTNPYCLTVPIVSQVAEDLGGSWCVPSTGFHNWRTNQGVSGPYGAVYSDSDCMNSMSHEIMETMTDPVLFGGWTGTQADIPLCPEATPLNPATCVLLPNITIPNEVADECYLIGNGNVDGGNIDGDGGFAWVSVNPSYAEGGYTSQHNSCQQLIPERHAPLAAAIELAPQNGSAPLVLAYIDSNGHVQEMSWGYAGGAHSNPVDLGQPSNNPIVKAVGKPSMVYSNQAGGEYLFVKGSDSALWMHHSGAWTPLGGPPLIAGAAGRSFFGDPQAVVWNWNGATWVHVAVLGTDDNLWLQGVLNGTPFGWGEYTNTGGVSFVSSPAIVTRAANSLDMFAVGEGGILKWMAFNNSTGWVAPVTALYAGGLVPAGPDVVVSTPTVAAGGTGIMELFGNTYGVQSDLYQAAWTSSTGWATADGAKFQLPQYDYQYGIQGSVAVVSWGGDHYDAFAVSRTGELWWWFTSSSTTVPLWGDGVRKLSEEHGVVLGSAPLPLVLSPLVPATPSPVPANTPTATGDPLAISRNTNEVEVFYRTSSGQLAHLTFVNGAWAAPEITQLPNPIQ